MAAIFAGDISKSIFMNDNHRNLNQISLKFVLSPSIDIMSTVQILVWLLSGERLLPEPVVA